MTEHEDVVADLVARGLYDPDAPDAPTRLPLLLEALELGASLEELEELEEAGEDLGRVVTRRFHIGGREWLTLAEAASRAGVRLDDAERFWRACGFPQHDSEARDFNEETVEVLRVLDAGRQILGEGVFQFARVLGSAMGRVADAAISTFVVSIGAQSKDGKPLTDDDLRSANEAAVGLLPGAVQAMDVLLRHHIALRVRYDPLDAFEGVDILERAVGFCDLVGYTSFAGTLTTRELSARLDEFETTASDLVTARGGNVVKLIGDEVMFIAPGAETACDIGLELTAAFGVGELPPVRCGIAAGRVILREGDYHGPVVNLAARIVKLAAPGGVLAPGDFRDAVVDGYAFESLGSHELKGFVDEIELVVVRRS